MNHPLPSRGVQKPLRQGLGLCGYVIVGLLIWGSAGRASQSSPISAKAARGLSYHHEEISEGPWSTHIVTVERANRNFEIHSSLARGAAFGLATLSDQIRALPPEIGRPVAGLNGDFFRRQEPYLGDPKGLQIVRGELVSAPCDWTCFWIDADHNPQMTNVTAQFAVTWPNGARTGFGLNEDCPRSGAGLYTSAVGPSTQTTAGRELILERDGTNSWLPLQASAVYQARVRQVVEGGNTQIPKDAMVLSLGRVLAGQLPPVERGAVLQISTATFPSLKGAETAVGGGPAIVRDGKVVDRSDARVRHPRAAVGWNKDLFFLVEVDGRQRGLSVGMTVRELARYMVKLGCTEAMNLDGGGSATCWVYGQVMNNPSEGDERGMGNAIVITHRDN